MYKLIIQILTLHILVFCLTTSSFAVSTLSWAESPGDVTGYRLKYGISPGMYETVKDVGMQTSYTLSDLNLDESLTYYFTVTAYNNYGESLPSNEVIWEIMQLTLSWAESPGNVTGYRLKYGTSSGVYSTVKDTGIRTTYTLSDENIDENLIYYFTVNAYNEYGESLPSNEVSWKGDTVPPLPAGELSAAVLNCQIDLNWAASAESSDIAGYRVYIGLKSRQYGSPISIRPYITNYLTTAISAGNVYYCAVTSVDNAANESGFSNEVIVNLFGAGAFAQSFVQFYGQSNIAEMVVADFDKDSDVDGDDLAKFAASYTADNGCE